MKTVVTVVVVVVVFSQHFSLARAISWIGSQQANLHGPRVAHEKRQWLIHGRLKNAADIMRQPQNPRGKDGVMRPKAER